MYCIIVTLTNRGKTLFDLQQLDKSFPMASYRDGQRECLEYAINAYNSGKRIVILECPTGGGKSAIGMTLANMSNRSYYITITKILQDQLIRDFPNVVDLKGRNSYKCTLYERYGEDFVNRSLISRKDLNKKLETPPNCATGFCKTKINGEQKKHSCIKCFLGDNKRFPQSLKIQRGDLRELPDGMAYSACPYYEQLYSAMQADQVTMNFSSFLYQTTMTDRFNLPRDLLIIDEAHNIEPQLLDFITLTISDNIFSEQNMTIPKLDTADEYVAWFEKVNFERIIKSLIDIAEFNDDHKEMDNLERILNKYNLFRTHHSNKTEWVVEYKSDKNVRTLILKPIYVADFAHDLLFKHGYKVLLLSATILDVDVMCRSLGFKRSDVAARRMKNRFPVSNRPIYLDTVAKMTGGKDAMGAWMPQLVRKVDELAAAYEGKRGIIHTHNFAIMEAILNTCKPATLRRIITQKECPDKSEMLKIHAKRNDSIIVAPAMHEGINLIDDLSRFQVICKVPYANYFDNKQLAKRIEVDNKYYVWLTALKLVQSYGRSIRSETDYADTYIIDAAIHKFLKDAKDMLPPWFTEAISKEKANVRA